MNGRRIYVLCDLEGVSGVVSFDADCAPDGPNYRRSIRLASEELNALIRGLREGGAGEILVVDGHGPGGLDVEAIREEVDLLLGRPIRPPFEMDKGWDALVLFAHHAMEGTEGANLAHSWSHKGIEECRLNDRPIGEIGWYIYLAGYFGMPAILITGDDKACAEARGYVPQIEAAVVKVGLNKTAAICKPPPVARKIIREAARRAMGKLREIEPVRLDPPYRAVRRYREAELADRFCSSHPWAERVDERTVAVESDDYLDLTLKFLG